jgi:hypothetical protein
MGTKIGSSTSATRAVNLHLLRLDKMRRIYLKCVSAQLGFVMGIKQQPLPQLVTDHVKWLFLWPTWNFGNGHQNRAHYRNSTSETRVMNPLLLYLDERAKFWGPPVSFGNGLLRCPLHCWHVCNRRSKWSSALTDQCLYWALINAHYRYIGHPYSNLPASLLHPGTNQDSVAIRSCILEPASIW